jgi:hypothetical protein
MTTLFPTFSNWLQRAKRFLATDSCDIWQRAREALEADEERYYQQLEAKGLDWLY